MHSSLGNLYTGSALSFVLSNYSLSQILKKSPATTIQAEWTEQNGPFWVAFGLETGECQCMYFIHQQTYYYRA
jgi:hypothetical protein